MSYAAFSIGVAAVLLATQTTLPDEAGSGWLSARFGREMAGLAVFGTATLSLALGILDVAGRTSELGPGGVLLGGWLGMRALTRKQASRKRVVGGAAGSLVALIVAEALAAWIPR